MNWDEQQEAALEAILSKGHEECQKCNLLDDLSRTEYLQSVVEALVAYYGLNVLDDKFKMPLDLLDTLTNILREKGSTFGLDTTKLDQLKHNAGDSDVAWQWVAAATLAVLQRRQALPKLLGVDQLIAFLRSPR